MAVLKHVAACHSMLRRPKFSRWVHTAIHVSSTDFCFFLYHLPTSLMSTPTATPTTKGSQKPIRNKETTRSTADCLQWQLGKALGSTFA